MEKINEAIEILKGNHQCCACGEFGTPENPVTFGPDPYYQEIHEDDSPVWECERCRQESADEI